MSSIDHRDAQVQHHFTLMKKTSDDTIKFRIAQQLAKMYQKNDDYTYGIFSRTYKFISQSNDKEDKKSGLIVLAKLGQRMQGVTRSVFVNKFHSPMFKLFENNQDESLIEYLEEAYDIILEIGGNRNDSVVESNLTSSLQVLGSNVKDVRRMSAYAILRVLVIQSPYITFKKILQKQKNRNEDNLSLITSVAKSKNIKVRKSYLKFISEYIQYIAQKKDQNFQKLTYQRLIDNSFSINVKEYKDNNEEYIHLFLETVIIFLRHLPSIIFKESMQTVNKLVIEKIAINKSIVSSKVDMIIQKSLILAVPLVISKGIQQASVSVCLSYLRQIKGDDQILAQSAINHVLETYHKNKEDYIEVYKSILAEIGYSLKQNIQNHDKNHEFYHSIASQQIKTIHILIKCHTSMNYSQLISKQALNQLASYALLIRLDEQTLRLVHQISKENIHNLGQIIQKKFILTITKILTGTTKKIIRQPPEDLKDFIQLLEKLYKESTKDIQQSKIRAIQALSRYRFREEFRDVIGSFVKEKVLKYYLEWGNPPMRYASVEAAFFLCVKKGNLIAVNQMLQILQKLVRVGVTDSQQLVRQIVFTSILTNLSKHDEFHLFFSNMQILNSLFQLTQDKNQKIRLTCLKIICVLQSKNTSPLIVPFLKKIAYNCFYHFSSNFKYYNQKTYWIKSFSILIQYASFVIQSHVNTLLQLLLKYLQDRVNYEGLEIIFFEMFKVLTESLPDAVIPYVEQVSSYLIDAMKDKLNSKKRILALKTFVSIIRNCGYVIIPYFQLSNLQQTLIYLLRSQIQAQSRNDLMRIIGGLGVIENYEMKDEMRGINNQTYSSSNEQESHVKNIISQTNFSKRKQQIKSRNESAKCDQQLKIYYDELLLLHSNRSKGLLTFMDNEIDKGSMNKVNKDHHKKMLFSNDSMINFNMVILKNLFDILCDVSLSEKHQLTIDILIQVLDMMGQEIQPQLSKIIPFLINLAEANQNILQLITIIAEKCDIQSHINQTLQCALKKPKNLDLVLSLMNTLTEKYSHSLRHYLESIVDCMYTIIQESLNNNQHIITIIRIYMNMKSLLEPYLSVIVPQMLDKFFHSHSQITGYLIEFFMLMAKYCPSLIQYVPQIINYFCLLLTSCHNKHTNCRPCLRSKICNCVVAFIIEFGNGFLVHLPLIHKSIVRCEQSHELYNKAIRKIDCCNLGNVKSQFTYEELQKLNVQYRTLSSKGDMPKYVRKVEGTQELIHEFDPLGKKLVDTDWIEWLKKTSIFLLKKSPNIILRACSDLAEEYTQLGLELYNISFFYFWQILLDEQKKSLIDNLKKILLANPKPFLLVRKTILNLAEFMNRKKCSFEINSSLLADSARDSSAYAKHLYYRELEFQVIPEKTIEKLIEVSMKLGQPQNAYGLFKVAANLGINCKVEWYQKIQRFEEAYLAYEASKDAAYKIPKLKCLSHINDEKFLEQINQELLKSNQQIAELATTSYANLQQWNLVEQYSVHLKEDTESRNFWDSIINVKKQNYSKALTNIIKTRKSIYEEISQLINFTSSGEPTQKLIRLQQLFQLQELIDIKLMHKKMVERTLKFPEEEETAKFSNSYHSKLQRLKEIWNDRLIGASQKEDHWVKLVYVRSLLFDKVEYFDFFYQYCEICIKESKINKFEKMVSQLKRGITQYQIKNSDDSSLQPKLQMLEILQIQSNFVQGLIHKEEQIDKIAQFLNSHQQINQLKISHIYSLCAKTLYQATEIVTEKTLQLYQKAAQLSKHSKDLNMLAIMNLKAAQKLQKENQSQSARQVYIFEALKAQMQSLIYSQAQSGYILQGFLKLISLINRHGHRQTIYDYFIGEFKKIPIEGWINVVPQMIAQLSEQEHNQKDNFILILKQVLLYLGSHHPESVLFSLNFAVKSKIPERIKPALQIIRVIRNQHPQLTQEAQNISSELGKAAIKLKEYWYDGIESAWATYNQSKSSKQVVELLKELCNDVFQRKNSNSELAFHQEFGQEIKEGYNWLKRYEKFNDIASFSQAFEIFYSIYKRVKDSFQNLKKVYLKNVSPSLVTTRHYKTTIPGMYEPGHLNIKINGFGNELSVLQSKQRPRKLTIYGDNGKQYNFLLKGRQDLRLDERVMQFLNLVNKLLVSERESLKKDLTITKYEIIPLTLNTGLIGWVENCDTLNELIKEYRQMNKIRMYVEKELYEKMCPDYAYLPMINKLQIFKNGLDSTQGKDLLKILWLKSQNCQSWVERRTNYTTSLATMSIVGYILGLGDRHPSNIMIKRDSGKVVHIDFGDCFQVAVLREKFPEKVPFRLTRMLQKAMGVAGINGLYRTTCESVLRILRDNKESLLAVLQTFAHDPIISWRITLDKNQDNQKSGENPFPQKDKRKEKEELIGSIMGGLQKELNEEKIKQNQNVLIPKTVDMQTPIRRHHEPKQANKHNVNEKASKALHRIKQKLKGRDFDESKVLSVEDQVSKLIEQAISHQNICQSWPGWCPFW